MNQSLAAGLFLFINLPLVMMRAASVVASYHSARRRYGDGGKRPRLSASPRSIERVVVLQRAVILPAVRVRAGALAAAEGSLDPLRIVLELDDHAVEPVPGAQHLGVDLAVARAEEVEIHGALRVQFDRD